MSHLDTVIETQPRGGHPVRNDENRLVRNTRNDLNVIETSRAQLVSSDVSQGPRRPSMTLEPARRERENSEHNTRRAGAHVGRRNNGAPIDHVASTEREGGSHSLRTRGHFPTGTESFHGRIVSNGHTQRENEHRHGVVRNSDHNRSTTYHQRPTGDHGTLRDLPTETMTSRRRDFQGVSSARTRGSNYDDIQDKDDRYIVPALPMPIAILCCVLNFIIPGFGSMTASVCVFCCAKTEDMTAGEKCGSCCTIFGIGVLQLLLVACFLIGWIWSCIWGITFIGMSASYYDDDIYDDEYVDTNNPMHRRPGGSRTPLPTPQVVEDQPYPGIRYEDVQRERNRRRDNQRRSRSRILLTPSNVIYPMRAPSNINYNSPPPPYQPAISPPPAYDRSQRLGRRNENADRSSDRHPDRRRRQSADVVLEDNR